MKERTLVFLLGFLESYLSDMVWGFGTVLGALAGVGITCVANAARHLPVGKNPWEHVMLAAGFGFLGYCTDYYKPILVAKNAELRKQHGIDSDTYLQVPWDRKGWLDRP